MKGNNNYSIDIGMAKNLVDAFVHSSRVPCELIDSEGNVIYKGPLYDSFRPKCHKYLHKEHDCEHLQLYGIHQSERFGGRYIYSCPGGMGWISVPIMSNGKAEVSLSVGPILLTSIDDYLADMQELSDKELVEVIEVLKEFPQRTPKELNDISLILLAIAIYLSDSGRVLLENSIREREQREVGEKIHQLKKTNAVASYPREREEALIRSIRKKNYLESRHILNELFAYILLASGSDLISTRTRSMELIVLISRAVGSESVDFNELLRLNEQYLTAIIQITSIEDLHIWLVNVIDQFINMIFDSKEVKHQDTLLKAIRYMKDNMGKKITLDEVSDYVGFSPTYFSKIFSEEFRETFSAYLTRLRIERAKELLLLENMQVGEISAQVGFEDQSYFTNVFRKFVGVTPARFRKKQGRLDGAKEKNADR